MNDLPFTSPAWPASAIEMRDPRSLIPNPENPRTHSPEQVESIRAAIDEFGWTIPCVIDEENKLWGGHGRQLAAFLEPPLERVPCVVAIGWTEDQKRAYMLAENRLAETSAWDPDLLRSHLEALHGKFDLAVAGFDAVTLPQFMAHANPGFQDPDAPVDAPKPDPVVQLGDLWVLGRHRLICGDATDKVTVDRLLVDAKPNLMVTDRPYGVDYDPDWRNRALRADGSAVGARATGVVENDHQADWSAAWRLFPGNVAYVWHGGLHSPVVAQSLENVGFRVRAQIVWVKSRFAIGRGDYHWQHEPALYVDKAGADDGWRFGEDHETAEYAVRDKKPGSWSGGRKQSTVWFIDHVKNDTGHGTQKPVECMRRPMENNSKPGDAVYEPFCGSGTSILAAEMSGRNCLAIELSPAYVQLAIERWQTFTGAKATLNGKTLEQVTKSRKKAKAK